MLQNHGLVLLLLLLRLTTKTKQWQQKKPNKSNSEGERAYLCTVRLQSITSGKAVWAPEAALMSHLQSEAERKCAL